MHHYAGFRKSGPKKIRITTWHNSSKHGYYIIPMYMSDSRTTRL